MPNTNPGKGRILSLDQFRGYTIFGMIFVNFVGRFGSISEFFKHHSEYITYADIIAPTFLFVAGVGFRFSYLRNREKLGVRQAVWLGLRRYLILTLIGILYYSPLNWHGWWDALVDIGLAGILALPFMGLGTLWRVLAAVVYLLLYQGLFMFAGYGAWNSSNSFDGGPLGPLSWAFSLLLGTILYDLVITGNGRKITSQCLAWGLGLCAAGWGIHLALRAGWPDKPIFWQFSQHEMTAPYPVFATGIIFLCYLPFYWLCDRGRIEIPTFTPVGANPLVIYLFHGTYMDIHNGFVPGDSRVAVVLAAFFGLYMVCYAIARYLYNNNYIVKI